MNTSAHNEFPIAIAPASPASDTAIRRRASVRQQVVQCLGVGLVALVSYLFINHFLLQSVQVVGVSMSPTLKNSGYYLLSRCIYFWRAPAVRDIVVIRDPQDGSYAVKRIVACEGDSVHLAGGHVYVNGRLLAEPYLPAGTSTFALERQVELTARCGKGEFFLLGDNRNNSSDSRIYGPVARQNILGAIIR